MTWKRLTQEGKAKKSWVSFDVGFELGSIFLLYSAPAGMAEDEGIQAKDEIVLEL